MTITLIVADWHGDSDLWRLAAILLHKYGDGAEAYAQLKADEASKRRDKLTCAMWKRVAFAVSELEQRESVHGLN